MASEPGLLFQLPSNVNPSQLECHIGALLIALHDSPLSLENFAKLIPLAHDYVLQNPNLAKNPATPFSEAVFHPHQLCGRCYTQRGLPESSLVSDDMKQERHFRFTIQVCMLRALSFKAKRSIQIWLHGLSRSLYDCIDCYKGFLQAKRYIGPQYVLKFASLWLLTTHRFLHTFASAQIIQFLDFSLSWEESVALNLASETNISGGSDKNEPTSPQLFAMLQLAGILSSKDKVQGIYNTVKSSRIIMKIEALPETPSGILAMAIDTNEEIRSWASKLMFLPPMSHELSVHDATVSRIVVQAMERKEWKGFEFLLKKAPEAFVGSSLPYTILSLFSDERIKKNNILLCLSYVLEQKGHSVWKMEDPEYPLVILSLILDNEDYIRSLSNSTDLEGHFSWMSAYLKTLQDSKDVIGIDEKRSEEWNSVAEEALKRLSHFLLERLQQENFPSEMRIRALTQGIILLSSFIPSRTPTSDLPLPQNTQLKCLTSTVGLHATIIARFVFRGQMKGSGEVFSQHSKSRSAGYTLVQSIFDFDCQNMLSSLRRLSEVSAKSQSEYKREMKTKQSTDPSVSLPQHLENLATGIFQSTATELSIQCNVCVELWKEAYNLCDSVEEAKIFLKPLVTLSAFVEPQLNSHIIAPKKAHQSLTTFISYKEQLKGSLLLISRNLRAMRGRLPMLLLDSSEDMKVESSLSNICYKMADDMVVLCLCSSEDIHKAAQFIIRSTFEEAETRSDCFRSLLQCNPSMSLQGIDQFLSSFLAAATSLVEANEAAKWMVRSFSDILDVLCSPTEGLLRSGTPFSFLEDSKMAPELTNRLPIIWSKICESIAIIFQRTPGWSRILPHSELTPWFRDVTFFATEVVAQVNIFRDAMTFSLRKSESGKAQSDSLSFSMLKDLAAPLEEAVSWLRINNPEIVQETRVYFTRGLECYQGSFKLPEGTRSRMLEFIDSQRKIADDDERMTLLSLQDLQSLRHLLEADKSPIEISDTEDDDNLVQSARFEKPSHHDSQPQALSEGHMSSKSISIQSHRPESLKQQKLHFPGIDSNVANQKPFESKFKVLPPPPRNAPSSGPSNKYQSASAHPSHPTQRPTSKLAQLRQDWNAVSRSRPSLPARSASMRGRELPEPQAPEAKRSFNGISPDAIPPFPSTEQSDQATSSESESSNDESTIRLADMDLKRGSPVKMRSKPRLSHKIAQKSRKTVLLDDLNVRRAQKDRQEAERKRKLREPPNFSPLHQTILSWDFFAEGDKPPDPLHGSPCSYQTLKQTYRDPDEYRRTFEPMLFLECWAEIQSAKEQISAGKPELQASALTITGRSTIDGFVILTATISNPPVPKTLAPIYNETDVVYLRTQKYGPSSGGKGTKVILAKVDAYKDPRLTLKCQLSNDKQGMSSLLVSGATFEIGRLFSLTTVHREYEALHALQYYDLLPSILLSRSAVKEIVTESEIRQAESFFSANEPQAEAIVSSIKASKGFHLIQGPPGTGKTKTISSLVAHFLNTRKDPAVPLNGHHSQVSPIRKKILLCAPSNAAVDEVARRIYLGVKLPDGTKISPNVVRVGREEAMSLSVKEFSLEQVVQLHLGARGADYTKDEIIQMQAETRALREQKDMKRAELETARQQGADRKILSQLEAELRNVVAKRLDIMSNLDEAKDYSRRFEFDRRRIQQEVLMDADVVCTTLGGAGHPTLSSLPFDFETVIIDEASQAVELDTLIPLRYGCQRCIMVGDPNQLPPTVISREAERLKYSQSLFVRLFNNEKNHTHLLSIQYRMHPRISVFPSAAFYEGRLLDGPDMGRLTTRPWHSDHLLAPLRFIDFTKGSEMPGRNGHSFTNRGEADLAAAIYERLRKAARRSELGFSCLEGNVGVISMYKEQVIELRRTFRRVFGNSIDEIVDFNTVDGFQGQEKETIILSCVRTTGIGFLSDFRRINVAITRAKSNLFVIADFSNLRQNDRNGFWIRSIDAARNNGDFIAATSEVYRRSDFPTTFDAPPSRSSTIKAPNIKANAPGTNKRSISKSNVDESSHSMVTKGIHPSVQESVADVRNEKSNKRPRSSSNLNDTQQKASEGPSSRSVRPPPAARPHIPVSKKHDGTPIGIPGHPPPTNTRVSRPPAPSDGPSEKAKASLFIPRQRRPPQR